MGARLHGHGVDPDHADRLVQRRHGRVEVVAQGGVVAGKVLFDPIGQVARGHGRQAPRRALDHGGLDGRRLALRLKAPLALLLHGGHVDGELDHLVGAAGRVEDGIVAGLDHDAAAVSAIADELVGDELARIQPSPEIGVGRAVDLCGVDEHPVVTPDDVVQFIAQDGQEVGVRLSNRPVQIELDHRLGAVDGGDHAAQFCEAIVLLAFSKQAHVQDFQDETRNRNRTTTV